MWALVGGDSKGCWLVAWRGCVAASVVAARRVHREDDVEVGLHLLDETLVELVFAVEQRAIPLRRLLALRIGVMRGAMPALVEADRERKRGSSDDSSRPQHMCRQTGIDAESETGEGAPAA